MTGKRNDGKPVEDPRAVAAWAAFVEADSQACAPPALAGRVRAAVHAEWRLGHERRSRFRHSILWAGAGIAACLLFVAVVGLIDSRASRRAARVGLERHGVDGTSASQRRPSADPPVGKSQPAAAEGDRHSPSTVAEPSPVLATLATGPVHDDEPFALVRIRVPRDSLAALGLAFTAPDEAGLVDVDVLVGDDGLPRDIRRVRTVLAVAETR